MAPERICHKSHSTLKIKIRMRKSTVLNGYRLGTVKGNSGNALKKWNPEDTIPVPTLMPSHSPPENVIALRLRPNSPSSVIRFFGALYHTQSHYLPNFLIIRNFCGSGFPPPMVRELLPAFLIGGEPIDLPMFAHFAVRALGSRSFFLVMHLTPPPLGTHIPPRKRQGTYIRC